MGFLDKGMVQSRAMQDSTFMLITSQRGHNSPHVLVAIDLEALFFGDAGQLDILLIELLLHDLFQRLEN